MKSSASELGLTSLFPVQGNVVIIRGLSEDTTKDALENYLENTRRSGGGAVEEVRITDNWAWVKFTAAEGTSFPNCINNHNNAYVSGC